MTPRMVLKCKHCEHRPPEDSVVEALQLHFQFDHDTDDVELDLVAVCECGATMNFERTAQIGGTNTVLDHHRCPACGQTGYFTRGKK